MEHFFENQDENVTNKLIIIIALPLIVVIEGRCKFYLDGFLDSFSVDLAVLLSVCNSITPEWKLQP